MVVVGDTVSVGGKKVVGGEERRWLVYNIWNGVCRVGDARWVTRGLPGLKNIAEKDIKMRWKRIYSGRPE